MQVNSVLSAGLLSRLDEHLDLLKRWAVSATFQLPEPRHDEARDGVRALAPQPEELGRALDRLLGLRRSGDRRIGNSAGTLQLMQRWPSQEPVDCHAGRRFCRVLADGRVAACDRPQAPVPAAPEADRAGFAGGAARLRRAGRCPGCWRNNTMEINRALGGARDALAALGRWV